MGCYTSARFISKIMKNTFNTSNASLQHIASGVMSSVSSFQLLTVFTSVGSVSSCSHLFHLLLLHTLQLSSSLHQSILMVFANLLLVLSFMVTTSFLVLLFLHQTQLVSISIQFGKLLVSMNGYTMVVLISSLSFISSSVLVHGWVVNGNSPSD